MYTKKELLEYLSSSQKKAFALIASLTGEKLNQRSIEDQGEDSMNYYILEILPYHMRHLQHHTAQLNMMLRQEKGFSSGFPGCNRQLIRCATNNKRPGRKDHFSA